MTSKNGKITSGTPTLTEALAMIQAMQAQLGVKNASTKAPAKVLAQATLEGGILHIHMPVNPTGHVSSTGKSMVHATTTQAVGDFKFSLTVYKKI